MADNSVITLYRRGVICRAASAGSEVARLPAISKIAFGNGGTDENGIPIPPSAEQTSLVSPIVGGSYNISALSYPTQTTARYTVVIPDGDMAGETINEAALVDEFGNVCAIKTMYGKTKDAGVTFTFAFDDEF